MTTNHTELCERLSADAGDVGKNYSSPIGHRIDDAVMLIEQLAARIAELEKERDALHENARQFYNLTQGDVTVIIRAPSAEKRNAIITASNRLRAALQAEKETNDG